MSLDEFECGYRYADAPEEVVGPFRSKATAERRVREDLSRVLVQRPAGSDDPRAWEEVRTMVPVCPGCKRVDCICGQVTKR